MKYLFTFLILLFPAVAFAEGGSAIDWTPILQAALTGLVPIVGAVTLVLTRALLRLLDAKTGLHTEDLIMATAIREVHHLEQTARREIADKLADGDLSKEDAQDMIKALGAEAKDLVMESVKARGGLGKLGGDLAVKAVSSAVEAAVRRHNDVRDKAAPADPQ